jgi:hypothetical protein
MPSRKLPPGPCDLFWRMDPQALYVQLGLLLQTMPDLAVGGYYPPDTQRWLARAEALMLELGDAALIVGFRTVLETSAHSDLLYRQPIANQIAMYLHRALAIAEVRAPLSAKSTFIPAGNAFEAMVAPAAWLHRAMSAHQSPAPAKGESVAARDQARRLPRHRAQGRRARSALQPPRQRPALALRVDRRGVG